MKKVVLFVLLFVLCTQLVFGQERMPNFNETDYYNIIGRFINVSFTDDGSFKLSVNLSYRTMFLEALNNATINRSIDLSSYNKSISLDNYNKSISLVNYALSPSLGVYLTN